jgi:energy-coupling factor transport system permease protein
MASGWFDRLHPLTKFTWAFSLALITYGAANTPITLVLLVLALLTPITVAQPRALYGALWAIFLPIGISLFIIQGLLFPGNASGSLTFYGVTIYTEALSNAGILLARIMTLGSGLLCVILTTTPSRLTQALAERGMPRSIEYILLMALQIIPDMRARAAAILEAQQSRGLVIKSLVSRVRALLPLIGPLVVGALVDIEERAMALELRAFASTSLPTRMAVIVDSRAQHIARSALLLCAVLLIGLRIAGRLPS